MVDEGDIRVSNCEETPYSLLSEYMAFIKTLQQNYKCSTFVDGEDVHASEMEPAAVCDHRQMIRASARGK